MTLKNILQNHTWPDISTVFLKIYPEADKNMSGYKMVFDKLMKMESEETDMWLVVEIQISADETYFDVSGLHKHPKTEEEKYSQGIEFTPWCEWLGMEISKETTQEFTEQEIIVHCLYEMTYVGFYEEKIQNKLPRT